MRYGRQYSNTHPCIIVIQCHKTSYNVIKRHTTSYKVMHSRAKSYRVMQSHTPSYTVIHRHPRSYKVIHRHAKSYIQSHTKLPCKSYILPMLIPESVLQELCSHAHQRFIFHYQIHFFWYTLILKTSLLIII